MRVVVRTLTSILLLWSATAMSPLPCPQASGSANVALAPGDDALAIATKIEMAWSQGTDFTCARTGTTLTVTDLTGTCNTPTATFTILLPGGNLGSAHNFKLNLMCASPLVSSVELDFMPPVVLSQGPNSISNLGDTIDIFYVTSALTVPTMGHPWLLLLVVAMASCGWQLLRHLRPRSEALS